MTETLKNKKIICWEIVNYNYNITITIGLKNLEILTWDDLQKSNISRKTLWRAPYNGDFLLFTIFMMSSCRAFWMRNWKWCFVKSPDPPSIVIHSLDKEAFEVDIFFPFDFHWKFHKNIKLLKICPISTENSEANWLFFQTIKIQY